MEAEAAAGQSELPFDRHAFSSVEEANDFLLTVLDTLDCGMDAVFTDGEALYWSRGIERLMGMDAATAFRSAPGRMLAPQTSLGEGGRERALAQIQQAGTWSSELDVCTLGQTSMIRSTRSALLDAEGNLFAMVGVTVDVTDDVALSRRLTELNHRLFEFARDAANRFAEPMSAVSRAAARLGQLIPVGDVQRSRWAGHIASGAGRLTHIVEDLLSYASLAGTQHEPTPVDLASTLDAELTANAVLLSETAAQVHPGPLPTVVADPVGMRIVFANLMQNAIRFRRQDRPAEVWVDAETCDEGWTISVADNGIGIDPDHHEWALKPFRRLHASDHEGTGIGLALCREIIEQQGGRIWIEGNHTGGTTVRFSIPAHRPAIRRHTRG